MSRQQQIEAGALAEYGSECRAMHHFIKGAEWADAHPNWISVEDKLPPKESEYEDNSIEVLATDCNGVYKGIYRSGEFLSGWFTHDMWELDNITHWIPIPEPPAKLSNMERT